MPLQYYTRFVVSCVELLYGAHRLGPLTKRLAVNDAATERCKFYCLHV